MLFDNDDGPMLAAADAAMKWVGTLPNEEYAIHEASPNAAGTGRAVSLEGVKQFPGEGSSPRRHGGTEKTKSEESCPAGLVGGEWGRGGTRGAARRRLTIGGCCGRGHFGWTGGACLA